MQKLNVTDGQTDRGRCNISHPGPSAPREIKIVNWNRTNQIHVYGIIYVLTNISVQYIVFMLIIYLFMCSFI